jgi:hypothetical protein
MSSDVYDESADKCPHSSVVEEHNEGEICHKQIRSKKGEEDVERMRGWDMWIRRERVEMRGRKRRK